MYADDWLKSVTKKMERAQCIDREMFLYASGRLKGLASTPTQPILCMLMIG
jgi:hypothetical protein